MQSLRLFRLVDTNMSSERV